ncbi:MAG: ABC transporter ATP-binding protein [Vallitaleaceae bacterium]|nr:ABC transporter ATP-binding protein [Vallitaleaceae bacterium]
MNQVYVVGKKKLQSGAVSTVSFIETVGLTKIYSQEQRETTVLNEIDLAIEEGEFLSIMGPSGSGKSTLLYLLGGLENPSSGEVRIQGRSIAGLKDKKMSELRGSTMGFVFQFYNLVPHLNVIDNILLPALLSGKKKKDLVPRMNILLKQVGLEEKGKSLPSQLSGGQQQRVAIARALIQEPRILLADEPIGNLDSKTGKEIMELFVRLHKEQGLTIIQVTHSMESALYGDRIVHLKDGVICEETFVDSDVRSIRELPVRA